MSISTQKTLVEFKSKLYYIYSLRILSKNLPNLNILRLHDRLVNLANKSMRKLNLIIQCTHLRAIQGFFPSLNQVKVLAYRGMFVSASNSLCKVFPICARSSRSEMKAQDWIFVDKSRQICRNNLSLLFFRALSSARVRPSYSVREKFTSDVVECTSD